jgi:hypothetical protein
MNIEKKSFLI